MAEIILVVGTIVTNFIALGIAWFKLKTAVHTMSQEVKEHTDVAVQKLNGMLTYFIHSADRPMWIKAVKLENGKPVFRMLEVNNEYAQLFGIKRSDYIGKTDLEAGWDRETSDMFYQNDLAVWASGNPHTFTEVIEGKTMRFRKLLLQTPDGNKKGVMGYAVDYNDLDGCCKKCVDKQIQEGGIDDKTLEPKKLF